MLVYRIAKALHEDLSGEGARRNGGRWNSIGVPMVYTSHALSLAALENLVHVDPDDIPDDIRSFEITIPEPVFQAGRKLAISALPADWALTPAPSSCAALGDSWQINGVSAVLQVPSAIVPTESNFLINPRHPDAKHITVKNSSPFSYDRLIKVTGRK
ncbi:MAG: RES family NAD+ phosphorylase [Gemmatimonadaceae bacterium]